MTIPQHENPLIGWRVNPADITTVGHDLQRPECILTERDGSIWTASARGGVVHITPDGRQRLIASVTERDFDPEGDLTGSLVEGTLPNGLAFAANGDILIANFGTDALELMTRDGATRTLFDTIDGVPLGKANFVLRDSKDRIWITVSTRVNPWTDAVSRNIADGYVAVVDERGIRIVADGFAFANEIRFDANEEWLYVAETCAKHVVRLRFDDDLNLTDREVYGPESLGRGLIDGITFDSYGNLWATMIFADRLVAITPDGEAIELFDDGNPAATDAFEEAFATGEIVPVATMAATGGTFAPWLASITFGGDDLKTVYLGSLKGTNLPSFRSPVAGLAPIHW